MLTFNLQLAYAGTGMQGWRKSMEDSHIADLNVAEGVAIFGVFDGHGGNQHFSHYSKMSIGSEVAQFVQDNFIKELQQL